MTAAHDQLTDPRMQAAVAELQELIRAHDPTATFTVGEAENPDGVYLRALDVSVANPRLEFAGAIVAARCERLNIPLATFDEALAKLPTLTRWRPPSGSVS